jgi:hypothetical protein
MSVGKRNSLSLGAAAGPYQRGGGGGSFRAKAANEVHAARDRGGAAACGWRAAGVGGGLNYY